MVLQFPRLRIPYLIRHSKHSLIVHPLFNIFSFSKTSLSRNPLPPTFPDLLLCCPFIRPGHSLSGIFGFFRHLPLFLIHPSFFLFPFNLSSSVFLFHFFPTFSGLPKYCDFSLTPTLSSNSFKVGDYWTLKAESPLSVKALSVF